MPAKATTYQRVLSVLVVIGMVTLAWILYGLDWKRVAVVLTDVRLAYLPLYVCLNLLCLMLRAERLRNFCRSVSRPFPWRVAFKITAETSLLGIATPGRIGELTKVAHLHARGIPPLVSVAIVVAERLGDFGIILFIGILGAGYFWGNGFTGIGLKSVILMSFFSVIATAAAIWSGRWALEFIARRVERTAAATEQVDSKPAATPRPRPGEASQILTALLRVGLPISAIVVVGSTAQVFVLARALGMDISVWDVGFAYAITSVVSLIPVSFSGLGTREAAYVILMSRIGVAKEEATVLSLLDGFIFPAALALLFVLLALTLGFRKRPRPLPGA